MSEKITSKQWRFIVEYPVDMDGAKAAIRAGFSKRTARQIAYILLAKPHIKAEVAKQVKKMMNRAEIKSWMVLKETAHIAFSNIANLASWDTKTVNLKDSKTLAPEITASVSEISETKHGVKIKMHDKNAALRLLYDYLHLSEAGNDEEGKSQTIFVAPELSSEESWQTLPKK